jgi:hypothetical protein
MAPVFLAIVPFCWDGRIHRLQIIRSISLRRTGPLSLEFAGLSIVAGSSIIVPAQKLFALAPVDGIFNVFVSVL